MGNKASGFSGEKFLLLFLLRNAAFDLRDNFTGIPIRTGKSDTRKTLMCFPKSILINWLN